MVQIKVQFTIISGEAIAIISFTGRTLQFVSVVRRLNITDKSLITSEICCHQHARNGTKLKIYFLMTIQQMALQNQSLRS